MHDLPPDARHYPATLRNRDAILAVLQKNLPPRGAVLEIGSGSGEHVVYFARQIPALDWQPSDPDPVCVASIRAWIDAERVRPSNLRDPVAINASDTVLPVEAADAVLCINVIHISPWDATEGLMRNAAALLPPNGLLYLYGPFRVDGAHTAPSNDAFDQQLRRENETWGVRDLAEVAAEASRHGLALSGTVDMPANNLSVLFRKRTR